MLNFQIFLELLGKNTSSGVDHQHPKEVTDKEDATTFFNPSSIQFLLYRNRKIMKRVEINRPETLESFFSPELPTRFLIHGWLSNYTFPQMQDIKNNYFTGREMNVFIVDWSRIAFNPVYPVTASMVGAVGSHISKFINFLCQSKYRESPLDFLARTSLIGHSLGAHVAGFTGKNLDCGRLNTIIGLDPAGPYFNEVAPEFRLTNTDADYVEVIHTNGGSMGIMKPIGDADFYVNGGMSQPKSYLDMIYGLGSHLRAIDYFVESLNSDVGLLGRRTVDGHRAKMGGEPSNYGKGVSGVYHLTTNSTPPYGQRNAY